MIVVDDAFFIFSVAYLAYFIALGLVYAAAFALTSLFTLLSPGADNINTANTQTPGASGITGFLDSLITQILTLIVTSAVYVFRTILSLYPYLLVLVFLAILHENQTQVMLMIKETYNTFLVQTNAVSWIRSVGWFFKVGIEVLGPLWNFVISTARMMVYNVGSLLTNDVNGQNAVQNLFEACGQALAGLSSGVYAWANKQLDCRFSNWSEGLTATTTDVPCLDYTHRRLDLTAGIAGLQQVSLSLVRLAQTLCPVGKGAVDVLVYPLTDPLLTTALNAAANAVLQLAWDIGDVTQLRCRAATQVQSSLVFCVPDTAPFFYMWYEAVENLGALLDNWLETLHDAILRLFLYKAPDDAGTNILLDDTAITSYFQARDYRLVRLGASLVAYTDGASVLLKDTAGGGERQFPDVFDPPVDVHYGLAPVAFARSADDVDYSGAEATSLMGCRCTGGVQDPLQLACAVFRFSRTIGNDYFTANGTAPVPLQFDNALTVGYLSCATVQVSVQPVRYPQLSSDEDDARLESRAVQRAPAVHECLRDPRRCNNVDALVYVKPLCLRAKSVAEQRVHLASRAVNRNRAACVEDFRFSSCYPFCVGVRYRYSGAAPVTLYGKDALDGGVWKSFTRCEAQDAVAREATVTTASQARFPGDTMPLADHYVEGAQRTACNMDPAVASVQVDLALSNASAEAPPALVNYEFDWVQGQPLAFAGDAVLVPSCDLVQGACSYTVTLHRFASTLLGQYQLRPVVTRIPAASPSAAAEWELAQSNKILLPYLTQDAFAERNLGAQTRSGVFYAVNPDLALFRETHLARCSANDVPPLEFVDTSMFRRSRLLFTRPRFECLRGDLAASGVVHDGTRARSCTANLTREVEFGGDDAFLGPEHLEASVSCRASAAQANCGLKWNLFISHVAAFDDLNVVVATRHGLASFIEFELGMRAEDPACYGGDDRITTRLYFVHTQTLAVQRTPFVPAATRQADSIVPPVMSLLAKMQLVVIKTAEVVVNEYALNLFGIIEQQMQQFSGVNQGRSLQHSVFDNRNADQFPLSLRGPVAQLADYHAAVDLFILKSFRYVGLYIGLDPALAHWTHSGVVAVVNLASSLVFSALYAGHYLWDDLLLPFVYRTVELQHRGKAVEPARLLRNLVFESIQSGRLRGTVLVPQTMFCNRLPQITAAPGSAAARLLFHVCRAGVETQFAAANIFATMLVFSDLNNCICRSDGREDLDTCVEKLPAPLQTNYRAFWLTYVNTRGNVDAAVCSDSIAIFRSTLVNAPNEVLLHTDRALEALASLPQEAAEYTGITTGSGTSCAEAAPGAPSARLTLTPQPVSAFKRCGYTKICQRKCEFDLLLFYAERARAANPGVVLSGAYDRFVPTTVSAIQGLDGPHFTPLLVQQYEPSTGESADCDKILVVLLRVVQDDYAQATRLDFEYMRICQQLRPSSGELTSRVLTPRTAIPDTKRFFFHADFDDADERQDNQASGFQVVDILAPHVLPLDGLYEAVFFLVAWDEGMAQNGVYEVKVRAGLAPESRWLLRSIPLAASSSGSCDFLATFQDIFGEATDAPETAILIEDRDVTQQESFSRNPMLTHASVVPLNKGTGIGLLLRLKIYFKLYEASGEAQMQEFVVLQTWTAEAGGDTVCSAVPYDAGATDALNQLMALKHAYDKTVVIEQLPKTCDAAEECYQYALAKFERIKEAPRGRMRKTTHVLYDVNETYTLVTLDSHSPPTDPSSAYAETMRKFSNMTVRVPLGGIASLFPEPSAVAYHRQPMMLRASTAGSPQSGCRARVLHVATPTDLRHRFTFYSLACVGGNIGDETAWLEQQRIEKTKDGEGDWVVRTDSQLRAGSVVEMDGVCDYMSCAQCADDEVRRRCYAAENCAVRQCIGTTFNHQNAFCVVGGLAKEAIEFVLVDARAGWFGFVEFYINIFQLAQRSTSATTINIEALSSYFVAKFCELKDVSALVSATIPSIVSTVYLAMRVRVLKATHVSELALDFVSPQNQLYMRTMTAHVTEVFHAILLGVPYSIFNVQKLVLCAADKLGEFSGGLVNFVDNDVGGEHLNLCTVDLDVSGMATVPSDQDIIAQTMLKDFGGQQLRTTVERRDGDVSNVAIKILQGGILARGVQAGQRVARLKQTLRVFVYANTLNTFVDWTVGVLYSLSRFLSVFDDGGCRSRPTKLQYMPQCVCQDEVYAVADVPARHTAKDGGLWCTGVLEMLDDAGSVRYVYNPYSLAELRDMLDGDNGQMIRYLECVAAQNRDCDGKFVYGAGYEIQQWKNVGVNPLSVLTRCRDNFAGKTWDSGNFAVYHAATRAQAERDVNEYDLDQLRAVLDDVLDEPTRLCLLQGPARGLIARCMFMFFEGRDRARKDLQFANYFAYQRLGRGMRLEQGHDACAFLSTTEFGEDATYGAEIQACQQSSATLCNGAVTPQRCRVLYSTSTLLTASSSNAVDVYSTNASSDSSHIENLYKDIKECSQETFEVYLDKIESRELTGNMQFQLDTSEGDRFHQAMDCILMGAYDKIDYMPADSRYNLTNLRYSRGAVEDTRRFELPCAEKTLYSRDGAELVEVSTCGTPARVSAIAYVRAQMESGSLLNEVIRKVIVDKLKAYRDQMADTENYHCTDPCCDKFGPECEVADVDFSGNFSDVASMTVIFTDIVAENQVFEEIQFTALTQHEVTTSVFCLCFLWWSMWCFARVLN